MSKHTKLCILFAIIIVVLVIYIINLENRQEYVCKFVNKQPRDYFRKLVKQYKQPDVIYNKVGGFVVWYPKHTDPKCPFSTIVLRDESLVHGDHQDFLYGTIIVDLSEEELLQILSVSKSFYYDRGTKELTVRCDSLNNIKAIFYLLFETIKNPSSTLTEEQVLKQVKEMNQEWTKDLESTILKKTDEINKEKLQIVGEKFQIPIDGSKRKIVKCP